MAPSNTCTGQSCVKYSKSPYSLQGSTLNGEIVHVAESGCGVECLFSMNTVRRSQFSQLRGCRALSATSLSDGRGADCHVIGTRYNWSSQEGVGPIVGLYPNIGSAATRERPFPQESAGLSRPVKGRQVGVRRTTWFAVAAVVHSVDAVLRVRRPYLGTQSPARLGVFTAADIDDLSRKLHVHSGPLMPTSVSIWLGKDLAYNWGEMMVWVKDEMKALDCEFQTYFSPNQLSFLPGSERTGRRRLSVVTLDLVDTYWDPVDGVVLRDVRPLRSSWPGLEVATLLALNPQKYAEMNWLTVPNMFVPGMVINSNPDWAPCFFRTGHRFYVNGDSASNFRE